MRARDSHRLTRRKNGTAKDDYKSVIADLEKQKAEIEQTIALLKKQMGAGRTGSSGGNTDEDSEIAPSPLRGG